MDRIEEITERLELVSDANLAGRNIFNKDISEFILHAPEDMEHLLSELDAAREELTERKAWGGLVGRKMRDLQAEVERQRHTIGRLVAWLNKYYGGGLEEPIDKIMAELGLTVADAIEDAGDD